MKAINLLRNSEISIDRDPMGSNGKKKSPKEFAKIKERVVKDISNEGKDISNRQWICHPGLKISLMQV